MNPRKLTDEQLAAATSLADRLFIEASPGSGKTTVAAERYGMLRFSSSMGVARPVVGLSFTRSATAQLRGKVLRRWGSAAVAWPHRVETIDTFLRKMLEYFLRSGLLTWPGGHKELEVLDDWHGYSGFRPLGVGDWCRFMEVRTDGTIRTRGQQLAERRWGFGVVANINPLLGAGLATPREIREILVEAFRLPAVQSATLEYMARSVGHMLVDEVFDANQLDLRLLKAACVAKVPLTIVGDPWQALYGWRGAQPALVAPFAEDHHFERIPLTESFRFESEETREVAAALRGGQAISLALSQDNEVALARKWRHLWELPPNILPLSFGRPQNQTQAALTLLLNHATRARLGCESMFVREAVGILNLEADRVAAESPALLGPLLDGLEAGVGEATVLDRLRDAVVDLGASQRPPAVAANEAAHEAHLRLLLDRLREPDVIPGLTVFQAKGLEWDRVGVHLTPDDVAALAQGLSQGNDAHRVIYVGLTRARLAVGGL
jgi:DNA helicase-2/ATP-dependent DNA helicase PcrA